MNPPPAISATTPPPSAAALRRWILAFCIIRFDLKQGQVIEECYPSNSLSSDHQLIISFSSFPDSNPHHPNSHRPSTRDSIFSFRFPSAAAAGAAFVYAYVFHRHILDRRLPRGADRKSVVILSHSPYSTVFRPLLQILAPLCFEIGPPALEIVAGHVAAWPPPAAGRDVELPIGGSALRAHLPFDPTVCNESDLFVSFRGVILQLWTLWELMIIGQPILVISPTPAECSEAVFSLVSLLAPVQCSVDFRPYFTIHDPDFVRLNSIADGDEFPAMVIGVTNVFFLKALRGIPHVVSVGSGSRSQVSGQKQKLSPLSLLNAVKERREGPLALMTKHREDFWSGYRPVTKADTTILNRLVDAGGVDGSISVVNNGILRRHFVELTTNFLAPFGPYLRAVTPLETGSLFGGPPALPSFEAEEFLGSLAARGPGKFLSKRTRSNWLDLYRRFLEGKNFMPWFQRRRGDAELEQRRLWREARSRTDVRKLIAKMSELETVDCFNAIEQHLLAEMQSADESIDSSATCCKLKDDLRAVFKVLPKDLQELLLANPKRAGLLHASSESPKLPGHPSIPGLVLHETKLSFLSL